MYCSMANACIILVHVVLTLQVLLYRLWVIPTPRLATQRFKACTLIGFEVATESAPKPRAYFSLRASAHFLEGGVRLDQQVFLLRLVGTLSAQRFNTRFVYARCCRTFHSHFSRVVTPRFRNTYLVAYSDFSIVFFRFTFRI